MPLNPTHRTFKLWSLRPIDVVWIVIWLMWSGSTTLTESELLWIGAAQSRSSWTRKICREEKTREAAFLTMSRLFLPNRLCAKCTLPTARGSSLLTPARDSQQASVFIHQQRRYVGGSNTADFKHKSKSRIWIYGVGVGIAIAVGLKYRADPANSSCDAGVKPVQRTDRFSNAIKVSRDLVERIKVSIEVGPWTVWFLINHFTFAQLLFSLLNLSATCISVSVSVSVVTQTEVGAPGILVGVSVDGAQVWSEGWCLKSPLLKPFVQHY